MEESQNIRARDATGTGPDAAIMFRHDWRTLASLPPARWLAAIFSFDLRSALMGPIEAVLVATNFHDPRTEVTGVMNAWGDHIGHTAQRAEISRRVLATISPYHASAEQIRTGYGSALIAAFTRWARDRGVRVIGGLPTEFDDTPMPEIQAIRSVYEANGGDFVLLPNLSRYPRLAFFDTPDHLNETWQIAHSRLLAEHLRWHRATIATARPDDPTDPRAARSKPTD
jgi:GNAT superfamily N-acetyltransferase